jgi:hypothetical protein
MADRVNQLEQMTQRQLEVISAQEETIDDMAKELVAKGNEAKKEKKRKMCDL